MLLFFDLETSGLPLWHQRSSDPRQPHLVQLAALLCDDKGEELGRLVKIVRPDKWIISPELAKIHGISHDYALQVGEPEEKVVEAFWRLLWRYDDETMLKIAHNVAFDNRIIRIALRRFGCETQVTEWAQIPSYCTMTATTDLVRMPPTLKMVASGRIWHKPPKLTECYQHLFGEPFNNPHDALADCMACRRIYLHVREL